MSYKGHLMWSDVKEFLVILVLCLMWYTVSSVNGVIGKMILMEFEHPMTLTLVQLASIVVFARPVLVFLRIPSMTGVSKGYYTRFIIPLAIAKFVYSVFSHISIWKVPVSYAHTVKATMPLFTVIISKVFLKEEYSNKTYASLFPIILGVAIATVTEVSFDLMGMMSALTATGIFASMAILAKKINEETGVHTLRLLEKLSQLSLVMFLPVWFLFDFSQVLAHPIWAAENASFTILFLLAVDGICHFCQNILAFTMVSKLSKLSYAVANVSKRIMIITSSIMFLQNHVTSVNIIGMSMAIGGVFWYNKVKLDEKLTFESLPTTCPGQHHHNQNHKDKEWNNNDNIDNQQGLHKNQRHSVSIPHGEPLIIVQTM